MILKLKVLILDFLLLLQLLLKTLNSNMFQKYKKL